MSEPIDINARRWANGPNRNDAYKPADALREALRQVEAGEVPADHVIICMGASVDGSNVSTWLQAGRFDTFQQYGLMDRIKLGLMDQAKLHGT